MHMPHIRNPLSALMYCHLNYLLQFAIYIYMLTHTLCHITPIH